MLRSRLRLLLAAMAVIAAGWALWHLARDRDPATDHAGAPAAGSAGVGASPLGSARRSRAPRAPAPPAPAAVHEDASATSGVLEGRVVVRGTTRGVPAAELAFLGGSAVIPVRSGDDGQFRLEVLRPGRYELVAAEAEGYLPFAPGWGQSPIVFQARPGEHVSGVVLHLVPATRLRARVVDAARRAVGGAELFVEAADETLVAPESQLVTDERGEAVLVAPGGAVLEARHPEHGVGRAVLDDHAIATGLVVVVLGGVRGLAGAIAGRVLDGAGRPIAGVLVAAWLAGPSSIPGFPRSPGAEVHSDASGRFVLEGLGSTAYDVTADVAGRSPARRASVPVGTLDLELRLAGGSAALLVRVRDGTTSAPVSAFAVALAGPLDGGVEPEAVSRAVFDTEGKSVWRELAAGEYAVYASAYDYAPARALVTLADGEQSETELALTPGGRLAGSVVDEKTRAPVAHARLTTEGLVPAGAGVVPLRAEGASDLDGRFEIAGLPPGTRSVTAVATGYNVRITSGIEIRRGEVAGPLTIALTPIGPGESAKTELVGIGAVLAMDGDALVLGQVVAGGGAALAGLAPGDRILAIDGHALAGLSFEQVVEMIRGVPQSTVLLRLARGDNVSDVVVERRKLTL